MKKLFCIILIGLIILPTADAMAVSAESYVLIDGETGDVLYESNADSKMLIASTTKIMTALVALERGNPDDKVEIKPEYVNVEGSSMYLKAGEIMSLEELLYGLMLASGNDAAVAVACHIGGSVDGFVRLMNEKAAELGADNTSFTNPHGLDDENHYSTAADMAIITAAAMENEDFVRIVSTKNITINGITYKNHNRLLWEYEGILGVKTGYTMAAGRTLVSCCERDGMRFICVTLNDPDDWSDHAELYDMAFSEFTRVTITDGSDYTELPVISGDAVSVTVKPAEAVTILAGKEDEIQITAELPRFVYAQVKEGETAGQLTWTVNGQPGGSVRLVYTKSVSRQKSDKMNLLERIKERLMGFVELNLNRFGYYGS